MTEISIEVDYATHIKKEQIGTVIAAFKGQIEYFSLSGFNSIDDLCLDQLVHEFPRLRDLYLIMNWDCTWNAELVSPIRS